MWYRGQISEVTGGERTWTITEPDTDVNASNASLKPCEGWSSTATSWPVAQHLPLSRKYGARATTC
jgi:hypothetical protein